MVTRDPGQIRPKAVADAHSRPVFGRGAGEAFGRAGLLRLVLMASPVALGIALLSAYAALPIWLTFLLLFALLLAASALGALFQARRDAESASSFGQYTLVRKIGEGGMGVVYEASHALLRRPTAIKLLRGSEDSAEAGAEALQRFEREVQLTSQLSHPNTVVIYDYGRTDEGIFYYAMEYIDGVDLERLVRVDGPLEPARVIHLALQVCASLAEAHQKSLIHRDIKPANLLVCERGGVPDTIKVLDFGLVKRLDGPAVSGTHVLVGTPLYMAPEVKADPKRASKRSDIYSLGAVLFWLATGKTIQEAAFAPTQTAKLPVDLERVILRCTEPDPAERPESMEALAEELRQCSSFAGWSTEDARAYWNDRGKRLSRVLSEPAAPGARTLTAS